MRVLMSCIPGHNHLCSMVPLARALMAGGHEVKVASTPSFCPVIESAGLDAVPGGVDWLESAPERAFPELEGLEAQSLSLALGRIIAYVHPKAMVPDLRRTMADWRPDVVVVESSEWAGVLAAELEGLPYALLAIALSYGVPQVGGALFPALAGGPPEEQQARQDMFRGPQSLWALRQELGLPPPPPPWVDQSLNRRFLTFDTAPPSLHFLTPEAASRTAHPLRPVPVSLPVSQEADLSWLPELPDDRPTVHVTMGTVFHRTGNVLRVVLDGLAGQEANVVVSGAPASLIDEGPLADNIRLERWVDYAQLLPRCDLVVTHGGAGTVLQSLYHGVPLLMIPQGADQPVNALRVRSTGAGRYVAPADVTPESVRHEVAEMLANPVYRLNARRLQAEIAAMPGPEEAASLLERLAKEGKPLEVSHPLMMRLADIEVPVIAGSGSQR